MANTTTYLAQLKRGGFPALGSKLGVIEVDDIDISAASDGDTFEVALSESACLVLAAGVEVNTATTGASTGDLGDGSTATLFGDGMALDATGLAQDATYPGPQMLAAGSKLVLSVVDADAGGTGSVRVWAVVADIEDLRG